MLKQQTPYCLYFATGGRSMNGCDLVARLAPTTALIPQSGRGSPRSSGIEGECGDGVGVRGRDGVLEFGNGWSRPCGVVPRGF